MSYYYGIKHQPTGWPCSKYQLNCGLWAGTSESNTSWIKGTTRMFVFAKVSFQPSHPPSTQHRALPATPAEGQNGNYLPATGDFPDVHPHGVSTDSKAWGLSSWQTYVEMHHLRGMSFGEDALGDDKAQVKVGAG